MPTKVITLTTDFGMADGYVGMMKGVILGLAPAVQLVDLSHDIAPHDVWQGAYILARAAPYFPPRTVHLAVVDPGVGSQRRPLVVETSRAWYVGPDNGLFTHALQEPQARAWELNRPEYWLPTVSRTFHGRDIFAPVAAHLALGVPPSEMGYPISDPVLLPWPTPTSHADGHIEGQVVHVDRFGNLITNIPAAWVASGHWRCMVAGREICGPSASYAAVERGELVIVVSSADTLEVAVRDGNAGQELGVTVGEAVTLWPAT